MFKPTNSQRKLFDAASSLPEPTRARLKESWAAPFQSDVLPVLFRAESRFAVLYCEDNGRPNWSIARRLGICLLQEMLDMTDQEVVDSVTFDARFHHALDLTFADAYLSRRSLCDFRSRLARLDPEGKLLRELFDLVVDVVIKDLKLSFGRQRLDSTQITSNIRTRGRVDLFGKTLYAFFRALAATSPAQFEALPDAMRAWHAAHADVGDFGNGKAATELQLLAEWCVEIVARFEHEEDVCSWESWELVRRLVKEHCTIVTPESGECTTENTKEVLVNPKADSGASLQSPHDPDATFGHKGVGYSVQIGETVGNDETEVITDFEVRAAASNDWGQTTPAIDRMESAGRKPNELNTDAGYPNPTALIEALARGVTLIAPVSRGTLPKDMVGRDRFKYDNNGTIEACPEGHVAIAHRPTMHANRTEPSSHAFFDGQTCRSCPLLGKCVARGGRTGSFKVEDRADLRLRDEALVAQTTPAWKERYRQRAGIEATNSELKRKHGLGRLRVRRRPKVTIAVTLKLTACNAKRWMNVKLDRMRRARCENQET